MDSPLKFKTPIKGRKIRNKWNSPTTRKGYIQNLNRIIEIFTVITGDENYPITSLTEAHAEELVEILSIIPKNTKKKYPKLSMKEVVEKFRNGEIDQKDFKTLSAKTLDTYLMLSNGMFKFANKKGYVLENPFQDIKIDYDDEKREPFTNKELNLFFNTDMFVKKEFKIKWAWRFWVPVIMLYTGCRLEEICQLFLDDIFEENTIMCIHLRKRINKKTGKRLTTFKNKGSKRIIPVHPKLIKIGLFKYINYLKNNGEELLFPTLTNKTSTGVSKKRGISVTRWFTESDEKHYKKSYIKKCDITDDAKVLHCFRHNVETCLMNHPSGIQHDDIDKIMGHKIKSVGRGVYGKYDMKTLLTIVEKIDYPDTSLPWDTLTEYHKIPFPWEK